MQKPSRKKSCLFIIATSGLLIFSLSNSSFAQTPPPPRPGPPPLRQGPPPPQPRFQPPGPGQGQPQRPPRPQGQAQGQPQPAGQQLTGATVDTILLQSRNIQVVAGQFFSVDIARTATRTNTAALTYSFDITPATSQLTLDGEVLNGRISTAGTYIITLSAADNEGAETSGGFTLTVLAGAGTLDSANSTSFIGGPTLPNSSFLYADNDIALPGYYRRGAVGNADNTPNDNPVTNAGATLGRVLFYDTKLSANDTISCSSCHQQANGFSDQATLSTGFNGGLTERHSMSLANARFYERGRFFWDERANTLEDQVLMPIQDPVEMGMTLTQLEVKLMGTSYYPTLFADAFGSETITSDRISRALAQFVRSLVSFNSKFDRAVIGTGPEGNFENIYTAQEIEGLVLFGQGGDRQGRTVRCARCHGTRAHISDDIHNNGLEVTVTGDDGAGNKRFKAPSLRNIALTAPYMHDGHFSTLEEVVEFYDNNVQQHPNLDRRLAVQNGRPRRLNMSNSEKSALVAFLRTLTDDSMATDPKFSNPFIN